MHSIESNGNASRDEHHFRKLIVHSTVPFSIIFSHNLLDTQSWYIQAFERNISKKHTTNPPGNENIGKELVRSTLSENHWQQGLLLFSSVASCLH